MVWMDKFIIQGGKPLHGSVPVSGSKNAVLPIMAATLLADGEFLIKNVPVLRDVQTMSALLECIGSSVSFADHTLTIKTGSCASLEAPYDLVKTMRASVYVLGPLLGRHGSAKVSLPGGCAWGPRPVNLHIENLKKLGAKIDLENGYILAKANRLKGARIVFDVSSVGATGNILMAAVLADGRTTIENAAMEPEITALAEFLVRMGAHITGIGTGRLDIDGVDSLVPASVDVIPDRVETGTLAVAAHITGGDVTLVGANPLHWHSVIENLKASGASIVQENGGIRITSSGIVHPVDLATAVYPGFPTDMQAQWMALMAVSKGTSVITETIFLDRFTHVAELQRFGADITLDSNKAIVRGKPHLSGAPVMSTDLRASACLVLAGLVARGRTDISRVYHLDRGYEGLEEKLKVLDADILREKEKLVT